MKLMFPKNSLIGALLTVFVLSLLFTGSLSAQSKKAAAAKKATFVGSGDLVAHAVLEFAF